MTDLLPVSENVAGAPTVLGDPRERWHTRRRGLLTASDCAAVLGADPRRGPLAVYAEKIGALEPEADNDWLAFGRDVEGAIAKGYTRRTGRPAHDLGGFEIMLHPDAPWLGATLDRMTEGSAQLPAPSYGRGPLELKAVGGRSVSEWKDREPTHYVIQLQIQIAVTGAAWGSLAPLFNGLAIEARDHVRNDRFLSAALPRLEEFWFRVQRREPPEETDALPATAAALRALFPGNGETVALEPGALDLVQKWQAMKVAAAEADEAATDAENQLRRQLGGASFGALVDGSFLRLGTTRRNGYTVGPCTYTTLRRWWPRLRRRA